MRIQLKVQVLVVVVDSVLAVGLVGEQSDDSRVVVVFSRELKELGGRHGSFSIPPFSIFGLLGKGIDCHAVGALLKLARVCLKEIGESGLKDESPEAMQEHVNARVLADCSIEGAVQPVGGVKKGKI